MSQEFLLKTSVAPAAPKVESTRVVNQPVKPENTDETSFSSTLDKHVEQNDSPKKESVERVETSANQPNENIKENTDQNEDGNILPENAVVESKTTEISPELITDLVDEELDASIITELKSESTKPSPTQQSLTKLVPAEQLVTAKVVTGDKPSMPSLNKAKQSSILGSTTESLGKGENTNSLELDKKPQTTNLRSDIFHALSKNKSSESAMLDDSGKKALLNKLTDRSPVSFATALTSATTSPIQNNATAQPVLAVQPAMQSSAWNQVMSSRVVWMAREGIQEASLKLNPANLGSVEVKLNMHNDQANVLFIAQNAATRDALEQALPRLRESFEENGMQLADADVAEQEFEQDSDEATNSANQQHSSEQQSQHDNENDGQAVRVENDVEIGLSLYA
ncbi:MAG: flagellar hook-length control protein FliK [Methylophagaceae bacterium]